MGLYGDKTIKGHHPMAKKAFEGVKEYNYKKVSSIGIDKLKSLGVEHSAITGKQKSLYSNFYKTNKELTLNDMKNIEIQAMVDVKIDKNYATSAVDYALVELYALGITKPNIKPWYPKGGKK